MESANLSTEQLFEKIANAGTDPDLWMLIGGPLILLILIGVFFFVFVIIRRKREKAALEEEMRLPPPGPAEEGEPVTPIPVPIEVEKKESVVEEVRATDRSKWLSKLKTGLSKTRDSLRGGLANLIQGQVVLTDDVLERLHEVLYKADVGVRTVDRLLKNVRKNIPSSERADWSKVEKYLKEEAQAILSASEKAPNFPKEGPAVVLVVGVNGTGKTTTIGKLGPHSLSTACRCLAGVFLR